MSHTESRSIPECLGLSEQWTDEIITTTSDSYQRFDTISETIEDVGSQVQQENFGTNFPLTEYEKKLLYAGVCIGQIKGKMDMLTNLPEPIQILILSMMSDEGE